MADELIGEQLLEEIKKRLEIVEDKLDIAIGHLESLQAEVEDEEETPRAPASPAGEGDREVG